MQHLIFPRLLQVYEESLLKVRIVLSVFSQGFFSHLLLRDNDAWYLRDRRSSQGGGKGAAALS